MPIKDLIYDVGMNNGDDTAYYLSLGFRTVAIEADPELVEQAKALRPGNRVSAPHNIEYRHSRPGSGASVLDLRGEPPLEFIRSNLRIVGQLAQSPNPSAMYAI